MPLNGTKDREKVPKESHWTDCLMTSGTGNQKTPIATEVSTSLVLWQEKSLDQHLSLHYDASVNYSLDSTIFFIDIIVTHEPDGLLVIVTATLLMTEKWMAKKNFKVKNLDAVETLIPLLSFALTKLTLRLTMGPTCSLTLRSMSLTHMKKRQTNSLAEAWNLGLLI